MTAFLVVAPRAYSYHPQRRGARRWWARAHLGIAAMAGAQAGARFGLSGIPVSWRAVEGHERLLRLADLLQEAQR